MGLFGGSSKNTSNIQTDVDVAVNPVFTVGIDTAERFASAAEALGQEFTGGTSVFSKNVAAGSAALADGVRDGADSLEASVSTLALAGVAIAVIFIAGRR